MLEVGSCLVHVVTCITAEYVHCTHEDAWYCDICFLLQAEKQAEREAEIESQKPEFMKVSLKKTKAVPS